MLYTLRQIKQRYNQRLVLDIDHLNIEEGRIHALLGANGAGKTTLLNILAFLEMPVSGSLLFHEQPVEPGRKSLQLLRRQVVLVDQQPIMFSTRVCDNIDFGLKIRKIEKKKRQQIIDEMLETVGLSRYKETSARELSGGETQRLALARALALQPDVLLCDEPTASVDAENQAIIIDLLRRINRLHGTTIIFATHNRLQATSLAQHTLTLENGRPAATSGENSYHCTLSTEEDGRLRCSIHGQIDLLLPASSAGPVVENTGRIFLNPEKMTLHRGLRSTDADNSGATFTGSILMIMAEEEKIRILINIGIMAVVLLDHTSYRRLHPAVGETLTLCLPADACTVQTNR